MSHHVRPRREARPSRFGDDERGNVAIPLILLPLALLAVMGTIHLAFYVHGRNVAAAAAQDALHAAQQFGGTASDGEAAAQATLSLFKAVEGADVSVTRDRTFVIVTVSGDVDTPISGFLSDFEITVIGRAERFFEESERG